MPKFTVYSTGGGYAVAPSDLGPEVPFYCLQPYIRRYYRARVNGREMNLDQQEARAQRFADKLNAKKA